MHLIATLGATGSKYRHVYKIGGKEYHAHFSFEALKQHFDIPNEDVYILGTQKTWDTHRSFINSYNFIKIDENSLEDIFHRTIDIIQEDDIVDLTQSFRSLSLGVFLALGFSKSLQKVAKDIFYAQVIDPTCNPSTNSCSYTFVSLKIYDEIADMSRVINTFLTTLLVLDDLPIIHKPFKNYLDTLSKLSEAIFSNNLSSVIQEAIAIKKIIEKSRDKDEIRFLHHHLNRLDTELTEIISCASSEFESEKLLRWSQYLLQKDLILHSITVLYESMVAFLDEELDIPDCNKKKRQNGEIVEASTYERRNCLKKSLRNCKGKTIRQCELFKKYLRNIDKLRNISAHAYTSDQTNKNLAKEIMKTIQFLQNYYPLRLSNRSTIDKLKVFFDK